MYDSGRRRGFTVVEVVIAMGIVVIMAAVMIPVVASRVRDGQISALAQSVDAFAQGIEQYRTDIRRYPTRLSQLTTPPGDARDACGRVVPPAFLSKWRGPYVHTNVTTAGFRVADATVQDSLKSSPQPMTATAVGFLLVEVADVDEKAADALEKAFDADDNLTDGLVRWTDAGGGRGTLVFGLRIRGC